MEAFKKKMDLYRFSIFSLDKEKTNKIIKKEIKGSDHEISIVPGLGLSSLYNLDERVLLALILLSEDEYNFFYITPNNINKLLKLKNANYIEIIEESLKKLNETKIFIKRYDNIENLKTQTGFELIHLEQKSDSLFKVKFSVFTREFIIMYYDKLFIEKLIGIEDVFTRLIMQSIIKKINFIQKDRRQGYSYKNIIIDSKNIIEELKIIENYSDENLEHILKKSLEYLKEINFFESYYERNNIIYICLDSKDENLSVIKTENFNHIKELKSIIDREKSIFEKKEKIKKIKKIEENVYYNVKIDYNFNDVNHIDDYINCLIGSFNLSKTLEKKYILEKEILLSIIKILIKENNIGPEKIDKMVNDVVSEFIINCIK